MFVSHSPQGLEIAQKSLCYSSSRKDWWCRWRGDPWSTSNGGNTHSLSLHTPEGAFLSSQDIIFLSRIFLPLLLLMTLLEGNNDFSGTSWRGRCTLWLTWALFLRSDLSWWFQEVKYDLNWIINVLFGWAEVLNYYGCLGNFETDQSTVLQHVFLKTMFLRNTSWTKGSADVWVWKLLHALPCICAL